MPVWPSVRMELRLSQRTEHEETLSESSSRLAANATRNASMAATRMNAAVPSEAFEASEASTAFEASKASGRNASWTANPKNASTAAAATTSPTRHLDTRTVSTTSSTPYPSYSPWPSSPGTESRCNVCDLLPGDKSSLARTRADTSPIGLSARNSTSRCPVIPLTEISAMGCPRATIVSSTTTATSRGANLCTTLAPRMASRSSAA
mmetsp:Transcript_11411/g.31859  ORF Transcript_11411/g.31859 Transcript_11411/m.31859 type:complete len:207 (-) Transcript_11411:642-1262(-)